MNPAQLALDIALRRESSFATYRAGPNAGVVALLENLASGRAPARAFLTGPPGSGKTHLVNATVRAAHAAGHACQCLFAEQIVGLNPALLGGVIGDGLTVIDAAERFAGRPEWEAAMFALLNRVQDRNGGLLVAANAAPADLGLGLADLRSRLQALALLRLQSLDEEEVRRTLSEVAGQRGLSLPEPVAAYLMRRERRDLGSLLALLDRIDRAALAGQRALTIPFVRELLAREALTGR